MDRQERRALIYCRMSQDREGGGLGIDRQEQDCRALADRLGWAVVAVHRDDDVSATSGKPRPGYRSLLRDLQTGRGDAVLAWHTDRLCRSPIELEEYIGICEPRGVPTETVKAGTLDLSNPTGRAVARTHAAWARQEVEHQAERRRRARLQAAANGTWSGGKRPFGYEEDGVTLHEAEAQAVRDMAAAFLAGESLRGIAERLNDAKVTTSLGGEWDATAVRYVLARPRNAGLMQHQRCERKRRDGDQTHKHCQAWLCSREHEHCVHVVGRAEWPAILDEETWRAVVATLRDPDRRTNPGRAPRWLLTGLAGCGVCGKPVETTAHGSRRGTRPVYAVYGCPDGHVSRNAAAVDELVSAVVVERLSRPDVLDLLVRDASSDLVPLRQRREVLRARLDELGRLFAEGAIDAGTLRAGSERLHGELAGVEAAIAEVSRSSVLAGVADAPDPAAVWSGLHLDRQRAIVDLLMAVTILPARKGRPKGWRPGDRHFDPNTVKVEPKRQ
jgi:site-specific DNA recombinase